MAEWISLKNRAFSGLPSAEIERNGHKMCDSDIISQLREKAGSLPLTPGVYLMKDGAGRIIYVGKSKALRNRVSSYFTDLDGHSVKTARMVSLVRSFE